MIAHFVESLLMTECDAAIDFHAGGQASMYSVLAMIEVEDKTLYQKNLELAQAFAPDFIWLLNTPHSGGSVNDAAQRQGVPMFASELYGGGRVSSESFRRTTEGLHRVLQFLGLLSGDSLSPKPVNALPPLIEEAENGSLYARHNGVFVPHVDLDAIVTEGDKIGTIYSVMEPEFLPQDVFSPIDGIIVSMVHRGLIKRGERLVLIAKLVKPQSVT